MSPFKALNVLIVCVSLCACSGSDDSDPPEQGEQTPPPAAPAPPPAPTRGTLIESPPPRIASVTSSDLLALLNAGPIGQRFLEVIGPPDCGVDVHQLRYNTVDARGGATTASGALMVPIGDAPECQGARPILVYAHGTSAERAYNIADLMNPDNAEGLLMAAYFVAQGYIVVAPNYVGYDSSSSTTHPYLNADQQSKDTMDALTAARSALPTSFAPNTTDAGKLFITGYSQGGFVAMATHRLLQQAGVPVTASAPMSGPYALGAFGDAVFYGQVVRSAPLFVAWLTTEYQRAYGDVYASPDQVFEARYATGIDALLPTTGARSELFAQGKLPDEQLFSSTPPDPSLAPYTPATAPADLAHVFARGFGPDNLVTNAFRLAYLQDAQANPDGGFPNTTNGLPAAAPANGLRRAFKANDLRNWTPTTPVLLCGGADDPTVLYLNTQLMQGYWTVQTGVAPITVVDVDGGVSLNDEYAEIKAGFSAIKAIIAAEAVAAGATDGGAMAVAEAYHSSLVPPFCLNAVRSFFDRS